MSVVIAKLNVASGEIRDLDAGNDRLVGYVLDARKFEIHLNLSENAGSYQERTGDGEQAFHRR